MRLVRRLLTAWILALIALAGGRYEVAAARSSCVEGCCCSEASSCCVSPARIKVTSPCGCGHDEGHFSLDLSAIQLGPLDDAIGGAARPAAHSAAPAGLVPPGRRPSPETPPPRPRT